MPACNYNAVRRVSLWLGAALFAGLSVQLAYAAGKYDLGTPATTEQIKSWDINVFSDGTNLPPGEATIDAGRTLYNAKCLACHGAKGEGGIGDRLAGGIGTLATDKPIRTVGSYWPYAPTLFDYIRRAMPQDAPLSLKDDEVYAVTGYVLFLNDLLKEEEKVNAQTLSKLEMPNRNGFIPDPRPDVK